MLAPKYSIILAAGKGTRMQSANLHKVCFPIDGTAAINRSLEIYNRCGIAFHIIVVGAMAEQVMDTVEAENVIYAYQAEQLGTAHAARMGARVLAALSDKAEVLIVAGDRLIEPQVLERFFDLFYSQSCDLAFLALPRRRPSSLGRILLNPDGSVLADVEAADIRQRQIYGEFRAQVERGKKLSRERMIQRILQSFSDEKAAKAFADLWEVLVTQKRTPQREEVLALIPEGMTRFDFVDREGRPFSLSPEEVENTPLYNSSVYLVKTGALAFVLERLERNNAQGEEYLPDMITILSQSRNADGGAFVVRALTIEDENAVMAFNDPAELLEIEAHVQARKQQGMVPALPEGDHLRRLSQWSAAFRDARAGKGGASQLREELIRLYGRDEELLEERIRTYSRLIEHAATVLGGDEAVLLVRSPGRVNLMGRHVDHQGGHCNLMTIGYETLAVVRPRKDDRICLYNLDTERFPDRDFSIGELVSELPWDDWISLINSEEVSHLVLSAGGDWSQYVKAAALRLQKKFVDRRLCGVDMVVDGNIPIAAGLSSSSALVVATAEAMVAVNRLDTFPSQFVDLCGQGEWFVGTRGGSADHAAIKYGQRGKVVKVTFFEFAVEDILPFPKNYSLLVCDSGLKAQKTTNAKDQFNHRVACYRIGTLLIKKFFPRYAPWIQHLRDVNTQNLDVPLGWIYKILLHLPEKTTRDELRELVPTAQLEPLFDSHRPPEDGVYPIRGVVLYGLAECARSRYFADVLKDNNLEEIGRLMNVSHDGDRVVRHTPDGKAVAYAAPTDNSYLLGLINDLESGDPGRVLAAQLQWQPGAYHCSIPEIDTMVDVALSVDGVLGAQLAGAGLGGCMMLLVHEDAVAKVAGALKARYYQPEKRAVSILRCRPISGSSVLLAGLQS
ncbi:MAG: NTP transferase domain-containing protein [Spirochaetaceae bacterium]|nr:MAG: NTP transferase domain-containing protein [Spirochaetaceae bacterium]